MPKQHEVEWVDVYDLKIEHCVACMKCRPDKECVLPEDDAHMLGRKIRKADGLMVGTPTHWGNMSAKLKLVFDRNVPAIMGEKKNGLPDPLHKGKPALIATACATPWPFNFILAQSRGSIRAVKEILNMGGYRVVGELAQPGTKKMTAIPDGILKESRNLGSKFAGSSS